MIPKIVLNRGLIPGTLVFATLIGCNQTQPEVRYVSAPPPAPVMQVQPTFVVQEDDYVYYPAYEVYYSSSRRDYHYRDGNTWVTRATPPRVSVQVLFASPSVHMDFRDAPERHHEAVYHSYPRNWSPPGRSQVYQTDNRDDRRNEQRPVVQVQAAAVIQVQPAPVIHVQQAPAVVVVQQDDYVYYPAYEVYYSSSRRDYHYRDGNAWVTRAAPPRVSADVLFASPSVRMDFRDAPEHHHETVIRTYPKNWSPPGRAQRDRKDKDDDKDERKDDRKDKH